MFLLVRNQSYSSLDIGFPDHNFSRISHPYQFIQKIQELSGFLFLVSLPEEGKLQKLGLRQEN